jgi:signal peptidase II
MNRSSKQLWFVYSISTLVRVLCIDRLSKAWAVAELTTRRVWIPGVLELSLVRNTNIVFFVHVPVWVTVVLVLVILLVLVWVSLRAVRDGARWLATFLGLIMIGAASNVMDRLQFGAVTDFISVPFWSVFNVADIAIVIGVLGVAACMHFDKPRKTASL